MSRILTLILISLLSSQTHAHLLKVFAYSQLAQESGQILIKGKVYFAGGATVNSAPVEVFNDQGMLVSNVVTDSSGAFSLTLQTANYKIVANTLDGHVAKWQISPAIKRIPAPSPTLAAADTAVDIIRIEQILSAQLAQQLAPLQQQITDLHEKNKYQDMIGAIGYIFGLSGLLLWFRSQNRPS